MSLVALPVTKTVPRDGLKRPLVIPKGGGKPVAMTRTTTFIDCIEDKSTLTAWGKRSVLQGVVSKPSLLDAVRGLDESAGNYKARLDALAEAAVDAAGSNEKRDAGSHKHELSEYVDRGEALPERTQYGITTDKDVADMAAYKLATINFEVVHCERLVVMEALQSAGTPDRVSTYTGPGPMPGMWFEDELLITDLKTGNTDYGQLKMAAQLAAYSRGEFYDFTKFPVPPVENDPDGKKALAAWKKVAVEPERAVGAYSPIGNVNQDWGVIFNLPANSGECTLYWVDLNLGWEMAQLALTIRAARSKKKLLIPFAA